MMMIRSTNIRRALNNHDSHKRRLGRCFLSSVLPLNYVLLSLLLLVCASTNIAPVHGTNATLVRVECPASQTIFTATTEMVLEGRSSLLSEDERVELRTAFEEVYNGLTTASCDSYFRRLANLSFVNMTNDLGDVVDFNSSSENWNGTSTMRFVGGRRDLQQEQEEEPPLTAAPTVDVNTTASSPSVSIVYEVTGTCRDCPTTKSGSFELYDDAFRRRLSLKGYKIQIRLLSPVRELQQFTDDEENLWWTEANGTSSTEDCTCVEGTQPTKPQAPGVQECVDEMNVKFDNLRAQQGLFENLSMADLLQLDEGIDELFVNDSEEVSKYFSKSGGNDSEERQDTNASVSSATTAASAGMMMSFISWMLLMLLPF